jgi:hypothetical protein
MPVLKPGWWHELLGKTCDRRFQPATSRFPKKQPLNPSRADDANRRVLAAVWS